MGKGREVVHAQEGQNGESLAKLTEGVQADRAVLDQSPELGGFTKPMKTGPEIVADFVKANEIEMRDFNEWFRDAGYPQEEANHHDSRYLAHLEEYVESRKEEIGLRKAEDRSPVPYFVKDMGGFNAALALVESGDSRGVMMRVDAAAKVLADRRLMSAIEGAGSGDLKKLYDATLAARDASADWRDVLESSRQQQDGLEIGRRILGEQLVKRGDMARGAYLQDGAPLVSSRGKALSAEDRFDRGNHMQEGRHDIQQVWAREKSVIESRGVSR